MVPPRTYFEKVQAILKRYDILFLDDEVICGFGRTGNLFGCRTYDFTPDARVVAMSALVTPTFESMKQVVNLLEERNLRQGRYVIIGGGPTTAAVRDHVGADAWTLDPKEGVNWCGDFVRGLGA
ncbi:MAG: aminotransferase class III-fold pyridoxal phosphate-dependent enzyme [Deltaproteobacteria bacterium]|nr:aminotransferase class III-fold pyridoxal phosphate-dependent enzyme [Deltaproteobacteria bacterium]